MPSAPPAHVSLSTLLEGEGDLLSLEPPVWVPDSHASTCSRCMAPFRCIFSLVGRMRGKAPLAARPHERVLNIHTDSQAPVSSQPRVGVAEAAQLLASRFLELPSIPDASAHQGPPKIFLYLQVAVAHAAPFPPVRAHLLRCYGCADGSGLLVVIEGSSELAADRLNTCLQVAAPHTAPLPPVRGHLLRVLQRGAHAAAAQIPGGHAAACLHQLRRHAHAAAALPGRCAMA